MEIKKQDEVYGLDPSMEYDPSNVDFVEWWASKFSNYMTMDWYTKNTLWIYWTRRDDEEVITDNELSNLRDDNLIEENEIAQIFRIDTGIFHFETSLCESLNLTIFIKSMSMCLLKIYLDSRHMRNIMILGYMNETKTFHGWLICHGWIMDLGWNLMMILNIFASRVIHDGDVIYFESYEWYENLEEGTNEDKTIQDKKELIEDKDDEIGYLVDYLAQDDAPFIINKEYEKFEERSYNCWLELLLLLKIEEKVLKKMESVSAQVVTAAKLPVLNLGEFKHWKMRINQYFLMTDYALWEVILNGYSPLPIRTIDGVETSVPPTTTE
ncbi:hypothetical protein Tco_0656049 [Tanacetum coccineum]|uniref:Uncharacterized protein n=1 Tax=Tanacetum coccineum TaxID=301880 RepID=A0ABQ4X8B7_9ASTR